MTVRFEIDFDPELGTVIDRLTLRTRRANANFARLLEREIEMSQPRQYTATSNPKLPTGSTYKRTFKLKGSIIRQVSVTDERINLRMFSDLDYAQYVIGERTQARIHRNRWKTVRELSDTIENKAPRLFEEAWSQTR